MTFSAETRDSSGVLQQKEFPPGDDATEAKKFSRQDSFTVALRKNSGTFTLDRNMSTDLEKGEIWIFARLRLS